MPPGKSLGENHHIIILKIKKTDYTNKIVSTKTPVKLNIYGYYRNTKSYIS